MPWYESNGCRLWYEDQGTGPAVVLLHGWCMSSAIWRLQIEEGSASHRVIAPDFRGHGHSGHLSGDCTIETFAADLTRLLAHLELEDVVLVGWSLGAQTALQAYGQIRQRIAALVLVGATPRFTADETFPYGLTRTEADGMALKVRRNRTRALDGFKTRLFSEGELDNPLLAGTVQAILDQVPVPDSEAALESLQSLVTADLRAVLPGITAPALILNGSRDRICLPGASDYLVRHIPGSTHTIFDGCGHAPFLTRSGEFNAALFTFSRRRRARSGR